MARIPTVGTGDVHTVQLSPELRRIERRRTRRAARRAAAPVLAADKATLRETGGTYRTQVNSIRGATAMTDSALMQALQGGLAGLSGKYRQQVKSELLARLHDASAIVPALVAEAGENRQKESGEARQQLREDRASMLQSAATSFNERLKELRTAGASAVKEKQDEHGLSKSEIESLKNASIALKDYLSQWAKNIKVEVNGEEVPIRQANPLESIDDWRTLAHGLDSSYQGFSLNDVMTVIKHFLQTRSGALHRGKLPQLSVPYGPRQAG